MAQPAQVESAPAISVVVPCRNAADHIGALLDALYRQDIHQFEVIVVDGCSTDRTFDHIQQFQARNPNMSVRILTNTKKHIPGGLNVGIAEARAPVVARLDTRSVPASDYLSRCLDTLSSSRAEVVGGVITILPGAATCTARAIAIAVGTPMGAGDASYRIARTDTPIDVDTVPFGCFTRATWERIGAFNEELLANEDYEFNHRVRNSGGRVHLNPLIRSVYRARPTLHALAVQYFNYGWWKAQMMKKWPASLRWRQVLPAAFVGLFPVLGCAVWFSSMAVWLTVTITLIYGSLLFATALTLGWRNPQVAIPLALAYATIHFAWGAGFWSGLLLFSHAATIRRYVRSR